jgi:hypothetical protein
MSALLARLGRVLRRLVWEPGDHVPPDAMVRLLADLDANEDAEDAAQRALIYGPFEGATYGATPDDIVARIFDLRDQRVVIMRALG